jgi:arginine/lysine/ornithine decarboxylase
MDAGADLCVTSVHKMGSGFEQGSVFHLQGGRITPQTLAARADLLGTTSPSVLLYAGLDGWRRQMVEQGKDLLDRALTLVAQVRVTVEGIDGLHVNGREDFCGPGRGHDMDPLQVFVDVSGLGVTGYQAADWMREHHRVNLHVCDHRRLSAQFTYADDATTADRLVGALRELSRRAGHLKRDQRVEVPTPAQLRLEQVLLPRDAFFGPIETVSCEAAVGRVAAEMLTPYPPGIPAALPGERLDKEVVRYLRTGVAAGMVVPDAADATVRTIRVAIEE